MLLLAEIPATELMTQAVRWWGPPGAIITLLALAVWYLYRDNTRIQEKRIATANDAAEKLQILVRDMSSTISEMTIAIDKLTITAEHLRDIMVLSTKSG